MLGQLTVLFLFVVMMLNVALNKNNLSCQVENLHIPSGLIVAVIIFLELLVIVGGWKYKPNVMDSSNRNKPRNNKYSFDWKCNVYRIRSLFSAIRNNFTFIDDRCDYINFLKKEKYKETKLHKTNF